MLPMGGRRLAHGLGAEVLREGRPRDFRGVGIDGRRLGPGECFVAVQGKVDGERYFPQALRAGAAALVGRGFTPAVRAGAARRGAWLLRVDDGAAALALLAHDHRRLLRCPVVAVTGSNGKSSTKDLLAHLLAADGPVLATEGNLNNHLGVPLTLLRAREGLKFAVLEACMNHAGELLALGRLIRPELAVELNVGDAHAGNFADGRRGVARAKEELLRAMGPSGVAVVNADDSATRAMGRRFRGRVVAFGRAPGADLRLEALRDRGAGGLEARVRWSGAVGSRACAFGLGLAQGGPARAVQASAALAAALALGADPGGLEARLRSYRPALAMRQEVLPLKAGATAVLDAYNASPQSMAAALEFLRLSAPAGRRKAVLGCMLELDEAPRRHRELGRLARAAGVSRLAALGEHAGEIAAGFGPGAAAFPASAADAAAEWMGPFLGPGDWCLFKGSRGLAVERVYRALQGV